MENNESESKLNYIDAKLEKIDNYLNKIKFDDLLLLIGNQQIQINNIIHIINLQSQLMNDFRIDLNKVLLKISDMEIRNNISDEILNDLLTNINQLSEDNHEIKNLIENIKIYNLPDRYFE